MRVDRLDPSEDRGLVEFLDRAGRSNPGILAYHYPFYRDLLSSYGVGEPCYLGLKDREELLGVLPGFVRRSEAGSVYSSLPFFGPNGGVLCLPGKTEEEIHETLLGYLKRRLRSGRDFLSASIYTPLLFDRFEIYDRFFPEAIVVEKGTQFLDLHEAKWPAKVRYDIGRARRLGVKITSEITTERYEKFCELYRENCRAASVPVKPGFILDALRDQAICSDRVHLYFAEHEGRTIAGLMTLWGKATVSYYLPCTLREMRPLQPSSLLIDVAAREASEHGLRYWNWEASPSRDSGVYRFKARWGSKDSVYRIYVIPLVDEKRFRDMGQEGLSKAFPYFFVYPFDRL